MPRPPDVPSAPTPSSPRSLAHALRGLFAVRGNRPRRWAFALRASVCMGAPVLVGWLAGDVSAGLMAGIGGFTALYGSGRPYPARAAQLALIALAFALCVGVGMAVAPAGWIPVVAVVALMAMLTTWMGNALLLGPPGAYMFLLACAAGTAMPVTHIDPAHAALLVLAGGGFAWLVHMAGVLAWPRGPEKSAVAAGGHAVVAYIEAVGTTHEAVARHQAALALHEAWTMLVRFQPAQAHPDGTLSRLRMLNRELHLLFADATGAASRHLPVADATLQAAREFAHQAQDPPRASPGDPSGLGWAAKGDEIPLGRPGAVTSLLEAIKPHSLSLLVILRVGVAAALAGAIGGAVHLERAYWAIAAAVLMLHQGMDWMRMLQRSMERTLGTWVGLLLAWCVLSAHPQGLWLVATIMVLQFIIEMLVMRNYALAVIFITSAALTIATGGHRVPEIGQYVLARGVDTMVGCAVALLVYRLLAPRAAAARIPQQLARLLEQTQATLAFLAQGAVTTTQARAARRSLQHRTFALTQAYDAGVAASRGQRDAAEQLWPAVAAAQRLAYRTLSSCWALERIGGDAARDTARSLFGADGEARLHAALADLAIAAREGGKPSTLGELPSFLHAEVENLRECLQREPG